MFEANALRLCLVVLSAVLVPDMGIANQKDSQDTLGRKVSLSGAIDNVVVGRGGQFVFCHIGSERKIAVVDVRRAKVVKWLPAPDDEVFLAAGRDKLLVCLANTQLMQRYDLSTLERDRSTAFEQQLRCMAMGNNSTGPMLMVTHHPERHGTGFAFYDVNKMEVLPVTFRAGTGASLDGGEYLRASPSGDIFTTWRRGLSPSGVKTIVYREGTAQVNYLHHSAGHLVPSADGSVLCSGRGFWNIDPSLDDRRGPGKDREKNIVPSLDSRFYMNISEPFRGKASVGFHLYGDDRPLVTLEDLQASSDRRFRKDRRHLSLDQKWIYSEKLKKLVIVPSVESDSLFVRHFDIEKNLKKSRKDYLGITSSPPNSYVPGEPFQYNLSTLSRRRKLTYEIAVGPDGMTVSSEGAIAWNPPYAHRRSHQVVVNVKSESGLEAYHKFSIDAVPVGRQALISQDGDARSAKGPEDLAFIRVDDNMLQLPPGPVSLSRNPDGRTVTVLKGRHLAILQEDGLALEKTYSLDREYYSAAVREQYLILASKDKTQLEILDRKTLKELKVFPIPGSRIRGLAIHPTQPIAYVSALTTPKQPLNTQFFVVDESTGKIQQSPEFAGSFLVVSRDAKHLVSGFTGYYHRGSRLLANSGRIHIVPSNGYFDLLMRYQLDHTGRPTLKGVQPRPGNAHHGIRLSPDGKRVAVVSAQRQCTIWNAKNFEEVPVIIRTEGRAGKHDLDFHPDLDLVAAIVNSDLEGTVFEPALFRTDTGERLQDKIQLPEYGLQGGPASRLYFSPDGSSLIAMVKLGNVDYLLKTAVNLSAAERKAMAASKKERKEPGKSPIRHAAPAVRLEEIGALAGGRGKSMSPVDIGRRFNNSVFVVTDGEGTGTGFVVGRNGLVLTCAHCVRDDEQVSVRYRTTSSDDKNMRKDKASVIYVDNDRDLALIRVEAKDPLVPVRLASVKPIDSGERITIIANPGLGDDVLTHTMTEGIVSQSSRRIDDRDYIQTSAAVNPGSSGGPLFDSRGLVVGLVVMKANIDDVGFAIPAIDLTRFLMRATKHDGKSLDLLRTWYDVTGRHRTKAALIDSSKTHVRLKKSSGRELEVPLDKLSDGDRKFLELLKAASQIAGAGSESPDK